MNVSQSRLESLANRISTAAKPAASILQLPIGSIEPNPRQPRKTFDPVRLEQLAASIRKHGIIQPVVVTPIAPGRYELVAGERRWRAAPLAGLRDVPAIVRDATQINKLVVALIENLDRDDMTPVDEARGVAELVSETSVQEAADTLGRTKQWVSKRTRIAKAPDFVQEFVTTSIVRDVEALYELAKLAEDDPEKARRAISSYTPGTHLREQLKAAQRLDDGPLVAGSDSRPAATAAKGEPAEPTKRGADNESVSHAKPRPASGSKEITIADVVRRGGQLYFITGDGQTLVKLSTKARQKLAKYLHES